ncbi:hypothetical protein BDD12DRAFT_874100 [Trichophaea hybrida]|nr:hypothetical protein BDD12DRAFT_874100 [Trichophaea hybrida]
MAILHDVQSCVLVSIGIAISTCGSFITAHLVDNASEEQVLDLSPLSTTRAEFYSRRIVEGVTLSFCPKIVVVSSIIKLGKERRRTVTIFTHVTVVLMVLGFISLYLGLRASEWWASLAILRTSAIASLARAWFIPDALKLRASGGFETSPYPFSDEMPTISGREDLLFSDEIEDSTSPLTEPKDAIHPQVTSTQSDNTADSPATRGPTYEMVVYRAAFSQSFATSSLESHNFLIAAVLALTIHLRKLDLEPQESHLMVPVILFNGGQGTTLYSDMLSSNGVWRQPLEIVVTMVDNFNSNPIDEILVPLKAWYWRAVVVRKHLGAKQIIHQNLEAELNVTGRLPIFSDYEHDIVVKDMDYIWMAVKISCIVFQRWTTSRLEQFLNTNLEQFR